MHTLMSFSAPGLEPVIIRALNDFDDKLRLRAALALGSLPRISKGSRGDILNIITADPPDNDKLVPAYIRKTAHIIQTMGSLNNFPAMGQLEEAILIAAQKSSDSGKKFMARLKLNNPENDQSPILIAAFAAPGASGSTDPRSGSAYPSPSAEIPPAVSARPHLQRRSARSGPLPAAWRRHDRTLRAALD